MDMEEKKLTADAAEQALPVQELPADIPAEVRQKLAEDLNEEATEDLKQDMREAEKEEANDEEVKANPEMLTKSRLLKLLIKKQYVKLREVTEEEQTALWCSACSKRKWPPRPLPICPTRPATIW